ncbi:hypothetical protein RB195_010563 [Necator americanus]|uniref:Uncharacterized protein n=1 Tax=Necator americanus TaxID=51031 RepID=A0ABR1CZB0_NECAM
MYDTLAKFVPLKFNKNYVPTYPLHLRNLFDQKNRLFYQLDNPLNNALYRKICADLDYHMKKYLAYHERRLSKTCMKKFHNFLAKRIKQAQKLPVLRTDNGNLIKTDLERANALAELFGSNYSLKLNERSHNLPLPTTDSSVTQIPQRSFDFVIYPNEVLTVLKRLNPSFTRPYDVLGRPNPAISSQRLVRAKIGPNSKSARVFGQAPKVPSRTYSPRALDADISVVRFTNPPQSAETEIPRTQAARSPVQIIGAETYKRSNNDVQMSVVFNDRNGASKLTSIKHPVRRKPDTAPPDKSGMDFTRSPNEVQTRDTGYVEPKKNIKPQYTMSISQ